MWDFTYLTLGGVDRDVVTILEGKGFNVIYKNYNVQKWKAEDISTVNLFGLAFFGHGYAGGYIKIKTPKLLGGFFRTGEQGNFVISGKGNQTNWVEPESFRDGSLGLLIGKVCFFGDTGRWQKVLSKKGKGYIGSGAEMSGVTWGIRGVAKSLNPN